MSDEGRKGPAAEDLLSPNNFLSYLGATVALLRASGLRVFLPFVLLGVLLSVTLSLVIGSVDNLNDSGLTLAALYAQLLVLPLVSSLVVPRVSAVMASSLAGKDLSFRAARDRLRGIGPHILAGGMVAAFLTLFFTQFLGLLGAFVGWHVAMGPPVFAQVVGFEKRPVQEAFRRVRQLAKGSALRVFMYLLCAALALVMFETILSNTLLAGLDAAVGAGAAEAIFIPFSGLVTGLGLAFMCSMGVIAYLDMRARFEDFDGDDLQEMTSGTTEPAADEEAGSEDA